MSLTQLNKLIAEYSGNRHGNRLLKIEVQSVAFAYAKYEVEKAIKKHKAEIKAAFRRGFSNGRRKKITSKVKITVVRPYRDGHEQSWMKKGFAIGYRRGYMHRSDKEYDQSQFKYWKKYVAGPTEKKATPDPSITGTFELIEPELIIR